MDYCFNPDVLKILLIIKTILRVILYIIPIILIVIIMIDFTKAITGDDKDLNKVINTSLKRLISAIIIFFIPTIVNAIFTMVSNNSTTIIDCYTNATSEKIELYSLENAINLVNEAVKTLDIDDYNLALSKVNKLKNSSKKTQLENKLNQIKDNVYLSFDVVNLKKDISKIKDYYTENNYNSLYKKIINIKDGSVRNELLALLENAKAEYDELHNQFKPLNVETGVHERDDYSSEMRYVEVIPEGATTKMPMIIYLHGIWAYKNFSSDAPHYTITEFVKSGNAYKDEKFIFIVPRVYLAQDNSKGFVTWETEQGKERIKDLKGLIDFLVNKYSIDESRIIITGYSLGGDGTWAMVENYPDLFAAAVPVSGCAGSNPTISNFTKTAIIAYHGTGYKEDAYKICVPSIYSRIKNAGGNIELRRKDGYEHNNMPNIYSDNNGEIFSWMLKQKK